MSEPMNRLAGETSPYLLQHRDNPVHWWPWGPDAFAEAQRTGKPVLLSVGYAACHWCHVMAHESFENPAIAEVMNRHFVNIKVDREERPDVDHVYMSALHAMGERGGWPLTMFMTPAGEPFWGGTYFPPTSRYGRPGFVEILEQLASIYRADPARIRANTEALGAALAGEEAEAEHEGGNARSAELLSPALLRRLALGSLRAMDPEHGGLNGAPKFPQASLFAFLWRMGEAGQEPRLFEPVLTLLRQMARGGIHDHVGGGFARYSVDERWLVPHFEKMLYDNAQLLPLYALAWRHTGERVFQDAAEGIVAWLLREMTAPGGGFFSSLDADSEGEEGRFYVWQEAEIDAVLGEDAALFKQHYDITAEGNFEHANIPNRLAALPTSGKEEDALEAALARLRKHRDGRVRPGLDDKVLADWNGLMISGLLQASRWMDRPGWVTPATRAYRFIAESMQREGRLGHSWREGKLQFPGFALDHAAMAEAALLLFESTGEADLLADARRWLGVLQRHHVGDGAATLAMTPDDDHALIMRPRPTHDDAVPNANGVAAAALIRLGTLTADATMMARADALLAALAAPMQKQPLAHTSSLSALDFRMRRAEVVVVGERDCDLAQAALAWPSPHCVVQVVSAPELLPEGHSARGARAPGEGAYAIVCSEGRCSLPHREVAGLREEIRRALMQT